MRPTLNPPLCGRGRARARVRKRSCSSPGRTMCLANSSPPAPSSSRQIRSAHETSKVNSSVIWHGARETASMTRAHASIRVRSRQEAPKSNHKPRQTTRQWTPSVSTVLRVPPRVSGISSHTLPSLSRALLSPLSLSLSHSRHIWTQAPASPRESAAPASDDGRKEEGKGDGGGGGEREDDQSEKSEVILA